MAGSWQRVDAGALCSEACVLWGPDNSAATLPQRGWQWRTLDGSHTLPGVRLLPWPGSAMSCATLLTLPSIKSISTTASMASCCQKKDLCSLAMQLASQCN